MELKCDRVSQLLELKKRSNRTFMELKSCAFSAAVIAAVF